MKNIFKTTMAMCLVFVAMLVANTSMAQSVTLHPTNIRMVVGEEHIARVSVFGGEIIEVTFISSNPTVVGTDPSNSTYSSRGPVEWFLRVFGIRAGSAKIIITVTVSDGKGKTTTYTLTLEVTILGLQGTPESLSSPESSVSMDAIKQD